LEATQALAQPERIVIVGSSSLLPTHPERGEPGQPLETSYDINSYREPSPYSLLEKYRKPRSYSELVSACQSHLDGERVNGIERHAQFTDQGVCQRRNH
jgi:hypothetical protein